MRFLVTFMWLFFATLASATEPASNGSAVLSNPYAILKGLKEVPLHVDRIMIDGKVQDPMCASSPLFDIDWGGSKDLDSPGKLSSQIEKYAIRRTKFIGAYLKLYPKPATSITGPEFVFNVNIEHGRSSEPFACYTVDCSIKESARLMRDEKVVIRSSTWSRTRTGLTPRETEFDAVKSAVCELVEEFEKEYAKATPSWISGGQDPVVIRR